MSPESSDAVLRRHGLHVTAQRLAVLRAFGYRPEHSQALGGDVEAMPAQHRIGRLGGHARILANTFE